MQYAAMAARLERANPKSNLFSQGVANESELHNQILDACKQRGWYVIHSRMDRPSTNGVGAPDFVVVTNASVVFIECKSKTGKLRPEQQAVAKWLETLGKKLHVVRSIQEFHEVVR